jgi:hypothetical protein
MAAAIAQEPGQAESAARRGLLLRWLDALASWQMQRSYGVIHRSQRLNATSTGVNQPSSTNERSSIRPCDR